MERKTLLSLHLLSDKSASSNNDDASLLLNGGATIRGNLKVNGNVILSGLKDDENDMIVLKDLIPSESIVHSLGNKNKKWENIYSSKMNSTILKSGEIYCEEIDVSQKICIGTNNNGIPLMEVSGSTIKMNGPLEILGKIIVSEENDCLIMYDQKNNQCANIMCNGLKIVPDMYDIKNDVNEINVTSTICLFRMEKECSVVNINIKNINNLIYKFVIVSSSLNERKCKLKIKNLSFMVGKLYDYVELMSGINNVYFLSGRSPIEEK